MRKEDSQSDATTSACSRATGTSRDAGGESEHCSSGPVIGADVADQQRQRHHNRRVGDAAGIWIAFGHAEYVHDVHARRQGPGRHE